MTPAELELLDRGLQAYEYNYKPGAGDGGANRHLGPMAQNLASTELGKGMVGQDESGALYVDGGRAALTGLGLIGDMHKRLTALEGGQGGGAPRQLSPQAQQAFGLTGGDLSPETEQELKQRDEMAHDSAKDRALAIELTPEQIAAAGGRKWKAWLDASAATEG